MPKDFHFEVCKSHSTAVFYDSYFTSISLCSRLSFTSKVFFTSENMPHGNLPCPSCLILSCRTTYICRTATLTSRCCILYIYSTNIRTEYFKHAAQSPFFSLQNAVYFIMLLFFGSCVIHISYTGCAKI